MRYTGKITFADLRASAHQLWSHPHFAPTHNGIVDLTDLTLHVSMDDFHALVEFMDEAPINSRGRWAMVTHTPLSTALSLLFKTFFTDKLRFEVFTTWEAACGFVAVDRSALPADFFTGHRTAI